FIAAMSWPKLASGMFAGGDGYSGFSWMCWFELIGPGITVMPAASITSAPSHGDRIHRPDRGNALAQDHDRLIQARRPTGRVDQQTADTRNRLIRLVRRCLRAPRVDTDGDSGRRQRDEQRRVSVGHLDWAPVA